MNLLYDDHHNPNMIIIFHTNSDWQQLSIPQGDGKNVLSDRTIGSSQGLLKLVVMHPNTETLINALNVTPLLLSHITSAFIDTGSGIGTSKNQ